MEDILTKIGIILEQKNILKLLEILDETQVHPQYEYIEVFYGSWKGFFGQTKNGLIIVGTDSGNRECQTLIEGLNQLGAEGWKIVHCQKILKKPYEKYNAIYSSEVGYDYNENYKKSYILERKITPLFNQTILDFCSETSKNLCKSPIINKSREEEALEEYEHDTIFKEKLNLSSRAYVCLKIADLASIEGLENLGYSSKARIIEIANMEQDVAEEIMQWIESNFGIEIAEED